MPPPASVSRWVTRCAVGRRVTAAPSMRLDLRRRRNGMPIGYRPGATVTPPSCTIWPLRSNTGTCSRMSSGRWPVAQTMEAISPVRRSADSAAGAGTWVGAHRSAAGRRRCRPGRPTRRSGFEQPAQLQVGQRAHVGRRPRQRSAIPSRVPASLPTSRTPFSLQRVEVERSRSACRPAASTPGGALAQDREPRRSARRAGPRRPSTTGCRGPGGTQHAAACSPTTRSLSSLDAAASSSQSIERLDVRAAVVPLTHDVLDRHWNRAICGGSGSASRTPSNAWIGGTPLSTGLSVVVIVVPP